MSEPADSAQTPRSAASLYGPWYYGSYTVPYEENEHWRGFFGQVADQIVRTLAPKTVLDAGCAKGYLVAALRERGVDACGVDLSETAINGAPEAVRDHLRVGSLTEPLGGPYDLITCIEVIEHLDPVDAPVAVANLAAAGDRILFSSAPDDFREPTHVGLRPPERWAEHFADHGLFRADHDAGYLSAWALLFERRDTSIVELVRDQERILARLQREVVEQRATILDQHELLERAARAHAPIRGDEQSVEALREEILRLRDLVVGKDAELATALGRVEELETWAFRYDRLIEHHEALLQSRSWRLSQALLTPLRWLRRRRA